MLCSWKHVLWLCLGFSTFFRFSRNHIRWWFESKRRPPIVGRPMRWGNPDAAWMCCMLFRMSILMRSGFIWYICSHNQFLCDPCDNMPLNTPIAHILQSGERNMAAFRHISYRYTTNERDKHSNVEIRCCIFSFLSGLHSFYRIATQKQDDTHFYYARLHE